MKLYLKIFYLLTQVLLLLLLLLSMPLRIVPSDASSTLEASIFASKIIATKTSTSEKSTEASEAASSSTSATNNATNNGINSSDKMVPLHQLFEHPVCWVISTELEILYSGMRFILLVNLLQSLIKQNPENIKKYEFYLKTPSHGVKNSLKESSDKCNDQIPRLTLNDQTEYDFITKSVEFRQKSIIAVTEFSRFLDKNSDSLNPSIGFSHKYIHQLKINEPLEWFKVIEHTTSGLDKFGSNYEDDEKPTVKPTNEERYDPENFGQWIRNRCRLVGLPITFMPDMNTFLKKADQKLLRSWVNTRSPLHLQNTYLTTMHSSEPDYETMMGAEFYALKYHRKISDDQPFIYCQNSESPLYLSTNVSIELLKYYVGSYLLDLDLSRSFITGSALAACSTCFYRAPLFKSVEDYIEVLYPRFYTDLHLAPGQDWPKYDPNMTFDHNGQEGVANIHGEQYKFTIRSGADVDIAIDDTLNPEEYEAEVEKHLAVIRQHYPYIKVDIREMAGGRINYRVFTDDPQHMMEFRPVEFYQSSFNHICTHHVGIARGAFTNYFEALRAREGRPAKNPLVPNTNGNFYLTASFIYTKIRGISPNYHYFAGKKSKPQEVIIKYQMRGFGIDDWRLCSEIKKYKKHHGINNSNKPFTNGRGYNGCLMVWSKENPDIAEIPEFLPLPENDQSPTEETSTEKTSNEGKEETPSEETSIEENTIETNPKRPALEFPHELD